MLPIPLQMFVAVAAACHWRWNVPAAALACWVTSPATWAITYGPALLLGLWVTGSDPALGAGIKTFDFTNLWAHRAEISGAFIIGCVLAGSGLAVLGYGIVRASYWLRRKPPLLPA